MSRRLSLYISRLPVLALTVGSLALTLFIFLNGFELASGKDLPGSTSLQSVNISGIVKVDADNLNSFFDAANYGNFGKPTQLRISSVTQKIPVVPAQTSDYDQLLARTSTGHYLITSPSKSGSIGNTLVYMRQNWRSIRSPENILIGDNMFLDTDAGWRYMFRINEVVTQPIGEVFVVADKPISSLTVVIENSQSKTHTIVVGDYVILQNITQ